MFPNPNEYQVQETDKDLATLAAKMNTNYQTLKTLNPYITSISPGQIVNLPPPTATPTPFVGVGPQPTVTYNVKPVGPQPTDRTTDYALRHPFTPPSLYQQSEKGGQPPQQGQPGGPGPVLGETAVQALTATLQNAKSVNDLPVSMALVDFNRTGWTLEQAFSAGYRLENGRLVLGGPGEPGGGVLTAQNAPNVPLEQRYAANMAVQKQLMESYRWYKGKYVKVGDLVRQGRLNLRTGRTYDQPMRRNAKGKLVPINRPGAQTPPSPLETVRPDTPSVTLDLILGT